MRFAPLAILWIIAEAITASDSVDIIGDIGVNSASRENGAEIIYRDRGHYLDGDAGIAMTDFDIPLDLDSAIFPRHRSLLAYTGNDPLSHRENAIGGGAAYHEQSWFYLEESHRVQGPLYAYGADYFYSPDALRRNSIAGEVSILIFRGSVSDDHTSRTYTAGLSYPYPIPIDADLLPQMVTVTPGICRVFTYLKDGSTPIEATQSSLYVTYQLTRGFSIRSEVVYTHGAAEGTQRRNIWSGGCGMQFRTSAPGSW